MGTTTHSAAQIANINSTISGRFSLAIAMRAPAGLARRIDVARRSARSRNSRQRADLPLADVHRTAVAVPGGSLVENGEQVHRATHSEDNAKSDRYLVELQPPSTTMV